MRSCVMLLCGMALTGGLEPAWGGEGESTSKKVPAVLDFTMKDINGKDVELKKYQGDVLLIVNVASRCGLTPQYEGLESTYRKYKDKGFQVLAFPANNFGGQEPGTESEIKDFCSARFDVTFDMFSKVSVKGDDKCPLYKFLTDEKKNAPHGGEIRWNFQKFLVDRSGQVVARFSPRAEPTSEEVTGAIEKALAAKP